jgi:serine O-acetyltransferase
MRPLPAGPPLTWRETSARLRADRARLRQFLRDGRSLWLHPSYLCVLLHRISHHLYRGGHRFAARAVWHFNVLLTGADISEPADIGPGLLVMNPAGCAIMGRAGRNLTVMSCAGLGGETGKTEDVGGGPGVPLLGDDVTLEPHCGVLGPVQVGSRVRVPAGIGLTQNVGDDMLIEGPRPRCLIRKDLRP